MIEPNDPLKLKQQVQARRRRKSAGWKSGLMLTGLGAVVAGAGYLAGVNAPAVSTASQTIARAGGSTGENQLLAPDANSLSPNQGQVFQFNGDDSSNNPFSQEFGDGNVGDDGTSGTNGLGQQSGGGSGTRGSNGLSQQFGGRRSRQFRGSGQLQPGFGGPVTRSRGS